jgi:hypothetical protein
MTGRFLGIALAGLVAAASATPAAAASWFELNFGLSGPRYDALVPLCDDRGVLIQIHSKFSHKEGEFWNSNLEILGIDRIREVAFRPWAGAPQAVPRRFCNGVARVSDGSKHAISYSILENTGWLGVGWGVEWCVAGLDRNWAYNPSCRMAKP